ncbi:bacitracin resistance protein [Microbacterium sp. NPDC096154]|uniref:bacitracin resistance protein n=1 Tax=Microbacterium sp. NPDC096154 TaxID=3155549 RepID=UPI003324B445
MSAESVGADEARQDAPERRPRTPTWLSATIAGVFGLLYAYAVWTAISYLVQWIQAAGTAGLSLSAMGWVVWVLAIAIPIAVFALAASLGWRRGATALTLFLLAGLSLVAVFWLDVLSYVTPERMLG